MSSTSKPRTMSQKTRAFLALAGHVYPREGDRGIFSAGVVGLADAEFSDDQERTVEVLRVSARGHIIWTRFLHPEGQRRYGEGMLQHRWLRDGAHMYYSTGSHAPIGQVFFHESNR